MLQPDVHRFTAFGGARCEIHSVAAAPDEVSACVAEVYAFEDRLSRFLPRSELSLLNGAGGRRTAVSPLLEELLRSALDAHAHTGGLVNAAVLPALAAAGYDRTIADVRTYPGAATPPARVPALPDVLEVGRGWARVAPGAAVDLGGVGKGWLADRLCERLDDAVVNLGGDLRARGGGADGDGWVVGLCDGSAVQARDAGVATSGTTGRAWARGHHLIDPRTGAPARTGVAVVSVVAADALTAEVLAKAVLLLGAGDGPAFARALGAERVAVVADVAAPLAATTPAAGDGVVEAPR